MKKIVNFMQKNATAVACISFGLMVLGLSLGDALSGHGVKGNTNLNPLIVGSGSSGSGSGSGSGSESGSGSGSGSSSSSGGGGGSGDSDWFAKKEKTEFKDIRCARLEGSDDFIEFECNAVRVLCTGFGFFVICKSGVEVDINSCKRTGNICFFDAKNLLL